MTLSAAAVTGSAAIAADTSSQANNYETYAQKTIAGSAILHCFDWSFDEIRDALPEIAAAGYTAVQTSPVQPPKDYNASWTDTSGQWWKLYQPLDLAITDGVNFGSWLGTKAQLKALCEEAELYGIQVVVDIVANHLANNGSSGGGYGNLSADAAADMKNSDYYHSDTNGISDDNRYTITQRHMGQPDLNTGNSYVQQKVLSLLEDCVDCGVDGFRFDAAKHIELPTDESGYKSNFWPTVINGVKDYAEQTYQKTDLFFYGEILGGAGTKIGNYTDYMAVTDNSTGDRALDKAYFHAASELANSHYDKGALPSQCVLWVESHDTYIGESGTAYFKNTSGVSDDVIIKAWAIVGSRADSTALFLARPNSTMGLASDDTTWKTPAVAEVNKFKNIFEGQSEYLASYTSDVAYNIRGTKGVVISKLNGAGSVSIPSLVMEDGTYTDHVSGNTFTVANGTVSGTVDSSGVAVVYNEDDCKPATITNTELSLVPSSGWKKYSARFAMYLFNIYGDSAWVDMTDADGDGKYTAAVPEGEWTNVIFCRMNPSTTENNWNNKWNQTADLYPDDGTDCYFITVSNNGHWGTYQQTDSSVLYFVPNTNWLIDNARFAMYFFNNNNDGETEWVSMEPDSDGMYSGTIPEGNWTNVIFCRMKPSTTENNWDNKWNQTSDLDLSSALNRYTLSEDENNWDGNGTWDNYAVVTHDYIYKTPKGMIVQETPEGGVLYQIRNADMLYEIFEKLLTHPESVDVSEYQIPVEDADKLLSALMNTFPELFFIDYCSYEYSTYLTKLIPDYLNDEEESAEMLDAYYNKASEILSCIDDTMDDFTKALVLHDQLVLTHRYQAEGSNNYLFMTEGWGRCENYTEIYAYLLALCGVKSEIVSSEEMAHEWLKVCIDGSYYHVDVTWDDPLYSFSTDGGESVTADSPDNVGHRNFLLSDSAISDRTYGSVHSGYTSYYPTSTRFDLYQKLHGNYYPIFYVDGTFYTIRKKETKGFLVSYDPLTDTKSDIYTINDVWMAGANRYYGSNYSSIAEYHGMIYFNGDHTVWVWDPTASSISEYASYDNDHLWGVCVKDGKLYGLTAVSPNYVKEPVLLKACMENKQYEETSVFSFNAGIGYGSMDAVTVPTGWQFILPKSTFEAPEGDAFDCWEINGETHEVGDLIEITNDTVITAVYEKSGVCIDSASIKLDGKIGLNFYFTLTSDMSQTGNYIELTNTVTNETQKTKLSVAKKTSDGYKVSFPLSVKQIHDTVTFKVFDRNNQPIPLFVSSSEGKTGVANNTYTYSASEYISNVKQYYSSDTELVDLVKALDTYASYSQDYLNYNTSAASLSSDRIDISDVTANSIEYYKYYRISETKPDGVTLYGYSLVVEADHSFRLYFKSDAPDEHKYYLDGKPVDYGTAKGMYYIEIPEIPANELGGMHGIKIDDCDIVCGALSYAYLALKQDKDPKLCDLVRALVKYYDAADAYFGQ